MLLPMTLLTEGQRRGHGAQVGLLRIHGRGQGEEDDEALLHDDSIDYGCLIFDSMPETLLDSEDMATLAIPSPAEDYEEHPRAGL